MRMADGVSIVWRGHRVMLKWHRARRHASDTAFTCTRILEALEVGASVEVDLNRHAGGGFAVLHDETLERETTGRGTVSDTLPETLAGLRLRDNAGVPTGHPVLLLADLARLARQQAVHPAAVLQLDLKTPAVELTTADIAAFAAALGNLGRSVILSSGDAMAVARLAEAVPGLRIGHDPCEGPAMVRLQTSGDHATFLREALAESPDAEMIYLAIPLILRAQDAGHDLVAAFQVEGRRVDAYTLEDATSARMPVLRRLLDLKVDQITTDDPCGLERLASGL
jgi:glycerophosphoryl diester phosphodiesterase